MSAFQALALCRAGCEINLALTAHTRELHSAIQEKYKSQVDEILKWDNLPEYVTSALFSHEDVNQKKKYGQDGAKMWILKEKKPLSQLPAGAFPCCTLA